MDTRCLQPQLAWRVHFQSTVCTLDTYCISYATEQSKHVSDSTFSKWMHELSSVTLCAYIIQHRKDQTLKGKDRTYNHQPICYLWLLTIMCISVRMVSSHTTLETVQYIKIYRSVKTGRCFPSQKDALKLSVRNNKWLREKQYMEL